MRVCVRVCVRVCACVLVHTLSFSTLPPGNLTPIVIGVSEVVAERWSLVSEGQESEPESLCGVCVCACMCVCVWARGVCVACKVCAWALDTSLSLCDCVSCAGAAWRRAGDQMETSL